MLSDEPLTGLGQFVRRKESYRRAHPCSGEGKRRPFPLWIYHDRNSGDLMAVGKKKIEVVPVRAAFPAFELVENREQTRFRASVNCSRYRLLGSAKF